MGATVETTDGRAPLRIVGAEPSPIDYEPPVASAQVKSAVLLAGVLAHGGETTVVEPVPTAITPSGCSSWALPPASSGARGAAPCPLNGSTR